MPEEGLVATCHVANCSWNNNWQCRAPSITVDPHEDHADCDTFNPKA